jgi:hypothetical protein
MAGSAGDFGGGQGGKAALFPRSTNCREESEFLDPVAKSDSTGTEISGNRACVTYTFLPVFHCLIQVQEKVALAAKPNFGNVTRHGLAHGYLMERT